MFGRLTLWCLGWAVVVVLLVFAATHLVIRGPVDNKGTFNLCDFASPWASARLWITGCNPYQLDQLWPTWITSWGAFETDRDFWVALMPPGTWPLLAPLAAMPAGVATCAWGLLSILSVIVMLRAVLALARISATSLTGWLVIAAALASAPVQTLVAAGQISLPVIAMIFLALWCARERRDRLCGVLLGVALAIKPQLATPFLAWFVFLGNWRILRTAGLLAAALTLVGILPLELRGYAWLADWSHNIVITSAPGAPNDPGPANPWRNQMIDLRFWLYMLLHQHELILLKGMMVCVLLGAAYAAMLSRVRHREDQLLPLATLCALTLLPVYHRMYDAALLLPAVAWALTALRGRQRCWAMATLVCLSIFLIPWDALHLIMRNTRALDPLEDTRVWRVLIFPHHALATLATTACLMGAMWSSVRSRSQQIAPAAPQARAEPLIDLAATRG